MELLTNILIWAGILIAVVMVALAIHEFVWKPRQGGGESPRTASPVKPEPEAHPANGAPVVEKPVETPAPVGAEVPIPDSAAVSTERPEESFKRLSRSQRLGLARLTIMTASFDRAAGLAVAACKETDFDAIVATGLIGLDNESGRYSLTGPGGSLGAEHLSPEDAELVRQFHVEHFSRLVESVHASEVDDREAAVIGFELVKTEWPHLVVVLELLEGREGGERAFLEFAEAVNATGIFQSRPADGIHWYSVMVEKANALGDLEKELDAVTSLGSLHAHLERHEEALGNYTRGAAICRELKDVHQEGSCLGNMGLALQRLGQTGKAEECFEKVLGIMRDEGDTPREGFALASLGKIAEERGDYPKAIGLHEEHLKLNLEKGDQRGEMLALAHLGEAFLASGQPTEAVARFERQLRLAGSTNDMPAEGNALGNLGRSWRALGNPDKAAEFFGRQIEVAHTLKDTESGLFAMGQLGQCHQDANRTWKAVECFDDQLKLARQIGDQEAEARALRSAARAVRSLGRLPDAITRISAALAIFESIDSKDAEAARSDLEQWRQQQV